MRLFSTFEAPTIMLFPSLLSLAMTELSTVSYGKAIINLQRH